METLLSCRSSCSLIKFVGRRFVIFFSNRHLYIIDACKEEAKICIELEEILVSSDLLYTKSDLYICYSTKNGSFYVISANYLLDESSNSEDIFKIIRPDFQKQVWKPSLPFELIAVNSESETCWFLESVTDCDKQLTCYRINCFDKTFTLDLLWICDYNQYESICKGERFCNTKSFYIISTSTFERLLALGKAYVKDDNYVTISDSLFVNLFGAQYNLECQLILMICFSNGIIHWFPHSTPKNSSFNLFWNLQEDIVNIHSIQIHSLNTKKVAERKDCLVVVGGGGSIAVFGMERHPAYLLFQVYCQIYSSDVFGDNLLFSTSHGIYALSLSNILNDEVKDKITPNLISNFSVISFKVNPDKCAEDDVRIMACLPDGRIVKFSVNLNQGKSGWQMKKPGSIKQTLASIEALENQSREIKKVCNVLSGDFSYLCLASHVFRSFKEPNWKKILESMEFINHSDLSFIIEPEYQCLCAKEQLYKVTINFQFDDVALKDSKCYSFLAQIVPSQSVDTFPRSLFKSVDVSENMLCETESSRCTVSFIFNLSSRVLPLSIMTFISLEFDPSSGLPPLLIPLKKFEAGTLKFVSVVRKQNQQCAPKFPNNLNVNDLVGIKLAKNSVGKMPDFKAQYPTQQWESLKILLKQQFASPIDIWRTLFRGNNDVYHILPNSTAVQFYYMQSIPLRLEVSNNSVGKPALTLSSTSMSALSSVHREALFILYEADCLAFPEKSIFPILETVEEPTDKQITPVDRSALQNPDFDNFRSLFHCYKMHRNF